MSNRVIPNISVRLARRFFSKRFRLASATRKSKLFNRIVVKAFFDGDDMRVIPKDSVARRKVIETDIRVEDSGVRVIMPSAIVKETISKTEDIFIMNFCLCRTSSKCKDYPAERGCIFLGEGIHRIPEEFGHIATPEEACRYIDECGDLGLVHIIGRNKLDKVWLNIGKKRDFITICNCCPCCCLWNMVRDISDEIGSLFRKMDSVEVILDSERCTGCGICTEACFAKAVMIDNGKCRIDTDRCRGCGRCAEMCPGNAISLSYDPEASLREVDAICALNGAESVTGSR